MLIDTTTKVTNEDGTYEELPTTLLSMEDAQLLRSYKQFLGRHGLREALYCTTCGHENREDGCKAFVTRDQIMIKCRCRVQFYQGQTI